MNRAYLTGVIAPGTYPALGVIQWCRHVRGELGRSLTPLPKESEGLETKILTSFEEENKAPLQKLC